LIPRKHGWFAIMIMLFFSPVQSATRAGAVKQFRQENRPENLKALLETIHHLIYVKKDARSATALLVSLLPNEERVRKALRDDLAPETLRKILDIHKQFRLLATNINELAGMDQKMVKVYGATTEEIAMNARGSVVFAEFPGGAVRMAEQILRPGMTFYEVEFLEPGKEYGMKYHLFFWDGRQWTMLGPVWRAL
jgi:hypothetical protein